MAPAVESMIASAYVRDIDVSRAFYELLGFRVHSSGKAETSAWSALQQGRHFVLLASTRPPLDIPRLPLLFYFYYDDLDVLVGMLRAAGVRAVPTGHPPHALGGEVRLADPDGNTLLLGQREPSPSQPPPASEEAPSRFSLLREAAAAVEARGGTTARCRVRGLDGADCPEKADVKVADAAGDTVWACLAHADELLVAVPGAFIASQDGDGIAGFVSRRR